jgi:hypothetical protein
MQGAPITARDQRWFAAKNLPLPERANEAKAPAVAAE